MEEFDKNLDKDLISYMNSYKIIDEQEIYSNKTEFVPIFRVKQWLEYNKPFVEIERLNNIIDELDDFILTELVMCPTKQFGAFQKICRKLKDLKEGK